MSDPSPNKSQRSGWLPYVVVTVLIFGWFLLPPPASTAVLVIWLLFTGYIILRRTGFRPLPVAGRLLTQAVQPLVAVTGVFTRVVQAALAVKPVLRLRKVLPLSHFSFLLEMSLIVGAVLFATSRFYDPAPGLQLSTGETEWITSSAYTAADGLRTYGRIPLWQPYLEFGEPLIDNPVTFVLNPVSIVPSLLIGAVNGLKVSVILTAWVAGLGGWLLGRTLGFGALGRVLLALLLVGKGNMSAMFNTGYFQLAASQAYFPWIIAGVVGIFRLPNQRWPVVALALGSVLLLFAGNVWYTLPMAICVVAVAGVYLIRPVKRPENAVEASLPASGTSARRWNWLDRRGLRRLALGGVLTFALSAVMMLPLGTNYNRLGRHPSEYEAGWVTPLFDYAIPFYFNPDPYQKVEFFDPTRRVWQTWMRIDELAETYYSFIAPVWFVALLFLLIPMYRPRWNRLWWVAWALLIFFTLWGAGGQPLFLWLYQHIPAWRGWRFVGRAFAVGAFWIAVLLAMRVDSLWHIIRDTRWTKKPSELKTARVLTLFLSGILIAGSTWAAYEVNREWVNSPNNVVAPIHKDDQCVTWLRAQNPDRELTIWRWRYEGMTTFMNNHVRFFDVLADFEMSPVSSTIGAVNLTTSLPEFAILTTVAEEEFMAIQGYKPIPGTPHLPDTTSPCLYRKADALRYLYTVPMETVVEAVPRLDIYGNVYVTLPPETTTPITTYVRQPDAILVQVQGDLLQNRVLTIQERAFPGWHVEVDGLPAKLESVGGQIGVLLPRDRLLHTVYFEYRPPLLILGGWITVAASLFCILYLLRVDRWLWNKKTA